LPQAFQNIGIKLKKPVGTLFLNFSSILNQRQGLSALECWKSSLEKGREEFSLRVEQMELLARLGTAWGQGDRRGQERQIALIQELLRQALQRANEEWQKNDKLWKYLGCLGGITIVLFLL
jgi:stage III sporulation protein AB